MEEFYKMPLIGNKAPTFKQLQHKETSISLKIIKENWQFYSLTQQILHLYVLLNL